MRFMIMVLTTKEADQAARLPTAFRRAPCVS
jgi:hypothetical protein